MRIRADLSESALVGPDDFEWVDSPLPGVQRVMLDRVGDERAIATSFVRYAPGSRFDAHVHGGGEEFVVLEGVFSDEHGDFPAGSYVRNPPGSQHTPCSEPGCVLFVKLWQFDPADTEQVYGNIDDAGLLFERDAERVQVMRIEAGTEHRLEASSVVQELVLLSGDLRYQTRTLRPWSWIRLPAQTQALLASEAGCVVFHKTRPVHRTQVL